MNLDLRLYTELENILTGQLEQLAAELVAGKATSFDDYRFRVGRLRGVQDALAAAQEAQNKVLGVEGKR